MELELQLLPRPLTIDIRNRLSDRRHELAEAQAKPHVLYITIHVSQAASLS
jgi:hypothetical protein